MRHTCYILLAVAVGLGPAASAESVSVLLEKGIHTEETVGDLDAAIGIYEQIIADAQANRRYVARAQFRLGVCRLKKGDKAKAIESFQRVVSDFPADKSLVARARQELHKLGVRGAGAPVVIRTTPTAFDDNVPASLERITVTFDQPMMDESWSWTKGAGTFPEITGNPSYDRRRKTCTLPVTLAPGKVYWVGVNSPRHKLFQTPKRVPAQPYVILFATKGADGKPTPIPEDLLADAREINARACAITSTSPADEPLKLNPVPWADGEVLQLDMKLQTGLDIGTFICTADKARVDKRDVWRFQIRRYIISGLTRGSSSVDVDRETFRPIRSRFIHSLLGDVEAIYRAEHAETTTKVPGKEAKKRKIDLTGVVYDNEQGVHLFRRLPLAVGYKVNLPICVPFGAGRIDIELEVTAKEKVKVPAGEFECYRAELNIGQTFWYSTDPRCYLVKFDVPGTIAELAEIGHRKPGEPSRYYDKDTGISLEAPAGWFFYKHTSDDEKCETTVHILDPEARAFSQLAVEPLEKLETKEKASPRAWAESGISERQKYLKGLKVRDDSWTERRVAGQPAMSCVADYVKGEQKMVAYGTWVLGKAAGTTFVALIERDQLEDFRKTFDAIIASYKAK